MQKRYSAGRGVFILVVFFIAGFSTLAMGVSLFLTKTPQSKSEYYMAAAHDYIHKIDDHNVHPATADYLFTQSRGMLHLALSETPYDSRLWNDLSKILDQIEDDDGAKKAEELAILLGKTDTAQNQNISFVFTKPFMLSESNNAKIQHR